MKIGIRQLNPQPGEYILELGCGTGFGLCAFTDSVSPFGMIYGLDFSSGMLRKARKLLRKSGIISSVSIQLGDACFLPYRNKAFSIIFLCFTLELFDTPDIPLVLSECKRVLKPDGRIGIVCLEKKETLPVRIYEWAHRVLPALVDCRPINAYDDLDSGGFEIITFLSKLIWGLPVSIITARVK